MRGTRGDFVVLYARSKARVSARGPMKTHDKKRCALKDKQCACFSFHNFQTHTEIAFRNAMGDIFSCLVISSPSTQSKSIMRVHFFKVINKNGKKSL